ncbi:ADP-ribose pyrophosphatase [bacterium BMS3Abin07]|nr:ADP-ribose pyrophosphatase [bacterium BMS3Abin07]GBE32605.1 ADP-ribose pyrophosphatase [bacterium BMS3Bbin05]
MRPKIIEKQVLWKGRYLQGLVLSYRNSRGDIIRWEASRRVGCNGIVAVVPFTSDGFVILIKQYRPPVDKYVIEFPAGLNDRNESLEDVARRELMEETGYEAGALKVICEGPLSPGSSTEVLTVYLADKVVCAGEQRLDSVEEIELMKLPKEGFCDKLFSLMDENTYIDLKIPGIFELAKKYAA